ncbi:MAG: hypothetical protein CTY12_00555 [Methylotenera sp.]|nr:MAG: hypothetical protein CTY12_00555 [Methylotenera sp.]
MEIITRSQAKSQGLTRYFTGVPCKHGHISEKLVSSATCLECIKLDSAKRRKEKWPVVHETYKRYTKNNKIRVNHIARKCYMNKDKNVRTTTQFERRQANYANYLLSRVKGRAKHNNMEFDITIDDITIPEVCPIFGIPLSFNKNHNRDNTPSLDRVDNSKGYIKGNVQVISMRANRLKSDATLSELRALINYMEQYIHES